jgi:hypothetical protein
MATTDLGDMARILGLDACGDVLDSFHNLPPAAPLDESLAQPPATDATYDPQLVSSAARSLTQRLLVQSTIVR